MAYDEKLAARLRAVLDREPGISERKMFGGLAFMANGNMACGTLGSDLMVRVGPDLYEDALARPHAGPMDFTGRPMRGMVTVKAKGIASDADLKAWTNIALGFVRTLPAK